MVLLCSALAWDAVSAKKRANNKYDGDFEFDEVSVSPPPTIMIKERDRRRESK